MNEGTTARYVKLAGDMARTKEAKPQADDTGRLERFLPWLMVIGGAIALLASIGLANEVFARLRDPNFTPVCNLNPILSCTNVADSRQAEAFGLPNYFIGIAGYAALTAIGVAMLAGAKFKRWFWQAVQVGLVFAMAFITWLQFETIYRIGALCLFCIIVWIVTWPIFWYVTLYNLRHKNIKTPAVLEGAVNFAGRHHADFLTLWYLVILALVLKRFWYYWSTLF